MYSNGLTRRWEYDDAGRLTLSKDVNGNTTRYRYRYDHLDNLVEMEEFDGNTHHILYDTSVELILAKDSLHDVSFEYGAMDVLRKHTQNNRSVRFEV